MIIYQIGNQLFWRLTKNTMLYNIKFTSEELEITWLIFVLSWVAIIQIFKQIAEKRIKKMYTKKIEIDGHGVSYWVNKCEVPDELSFDIVANDIILFENIDYFIVKCTSLVISFGRMGFGAGMSKHKAWCLVAVGSVAINKLESIPFLFKRVSSKNDCACIYLIKHLYMFSRWR